jgi:hypothetical protein
MKKFYKYMSYSTLKHFINDPCLRVTPSNCQNDSFEFGYSARDVDHLNEASSSMKLGTHLSDYSRLHGIISLTTSKNNILMWSHYAGNHKGAVVELYIDDDNPQSLFINNTGPNKPPFDCQDFIFDKISYAKKRRFNGIESEDSLENIKRHYYFTKARPWKTEAEYRFITPMNWVNKILFSEAGYKRAIEITNYHPSSFIYHKSSKLHELNPATLDMLPIEILERLWSQSNMNDTMFFIRLSNGIPGKEATRIGRVYLGCRANYDDFVSLLKNTDYEPRSIMGNYYKFLTDELCGVSKGEIDTDEYKLIFKPLEISERQDRRFD